MVFPVTPLPFYGIQHLVAKSVFLYVAGSDLWGGAAVDDISTPFGRSL